MADNFKIKGDRVIFHPGYYIEEFIFFKGWSPEHLAKETGISSDEIAELLKGEQSITEETAKRLEKATHITARTWMNIQKAFDRGGHEE